MRLATIRIDGSTRAVKADGDTLIDLGASDVGELLSHEGWADRATAATAAVAAAWPAAGAAYAPLVPRPSKVVCVGLNYRTHIQEMGRDLPKYPTLFATAIRGAVGISSSAESGNVCPILQTALREYVSRSRQGATALAIQPTAAIRRPSATADRPAER